MKCVCAKKKVSLQKKKSLSMLVIDTIVPQCNAQILIDETSQTKRKQAKFTF